MERGRPRPLGPRHNARLSPFTRKLATRNGARASPPAPGPGTTRGCCLSRVSAPREMERGRPRPLPARHNARLPPFTRKLATRNGARASPPAPRPGTTRGCCLSRVSSPREMERGRPRPLRPRHNARLPPFTRKLATRNGARASPPAPRISGIFPQAVLYPSAYASRLVFARLPASLRRS